jgi:hypothetical protein
VDLVAEETIVNGLTAGPNEDDTRDYGVQYSKYMVVVGRTTIGNSSAHETRSDPDAYIADLRQVGTTGLTMITFDDLRSGQWDQFGYQTPIAQAGFRALGGVSAADAQLMIDQKLTYWIEGVVQAEKPVSFVFKVGDDALYTDCENDGEPGIAVTEGRTTTAQVTLHGDHLWFDSLVRGDESTVVRRAAWLVKADKDGDGKVSSDDLKSVKAEEVFPTSQGYNLSNARPIVTAYDFIVAQLASQGHLNGEGECVTTAQ